MGVLLSGFIAYRAMQGPSVETRVPAPPAPPPVESAPSIPPQTSIDDPSASGEVRVKQLITNYAVEGCETVLLEPTRIVGGRDIDAKLVANGACMRLLASSGTNGDTLELTMQTPKGKRVPVPPPASEFDFLYCANQAGLHPATIRSLGDHAFTVSSIECPRSTNTKGSH